jgi:hypothetical protein
MGGTSPRAIEEGTTVEGLGPKHIAEIEGIFARGDSTPNMRADADGAPPRPSQAM